MLVVRRAQHRFSPQIEMSEPPEPGVPVETIRDEDINLGKNCCTIAYNQTIKNRKNNYDYILLFTLLIYQNLSFNYSYTLLFTLLI